jgi:hypothetical protein
MFWSGEATSDPIFETVTFEISFRAATYWNVKFRIRMIIRLIMGWYYWYSDINCYTFVWKC